MLWPYFNFLINYLNNTSGVLISILYHHLNLNWVYYVLSSVPGAFMSILFKFHSNIMRG
jgi:hypothetical protein